MCTLPRSSSSIAECDGVDDVAVVGFPKLPEGQEIAAFVVCRGFDRGRPGRPLPYAARPDKRPRKFVFVPDLPRNANGKVLRSELRKWLEEPC